MNKRYEVSLHTSNILIIGDCLGSLEHRAADGFRTVAGEEEVTGVADLLESYGKIIVFPGFFFEVQVNPDLEVGHRVNVRHDFVEFVDEALCYM